MLIKNIIASIIKDSRLESTIKVIIESDQGKFITSAPNGKSTGKYEVKPYTKNINHDVSFINSLNLRNISSYNFNEFIDLKIIEKIVKNNIGGNSLYALEASLLKAVAEENGKDLWELLLEGKKNITIPIPVGNSIGGGLHSRGIFGKRPDIQEFIFIPHGKNIQENKRLNEIAYSIAQKVLQSKKRNDEGAWETSENNEYILNVMSNIRHYIKKRYNKNIYIGIDVAASTFYKVNYCYKNPLNNLNIKEQLNYIEDIIKKYNIYYIEDPFEEDDFSGFSKLLKKLGDNSLIVGDDLTTTNPKRLKIAIKNKSINAIIIKPNQIGSLLKVKKVIDIARKNKIKTIISHRSGETLDSTIADLAVGFGCDFIKTGIYGKVREVKLKRLIEIENYINNKKIKKFYH